MPRHPDPDLEERILNAAQKIWKRGGEKALTMRTVARAARTNTPAVYRRFKNREDLLRGLLLRIATRIRAEFDAEQTIESMSETYVDSALRDPHEYNLFYSHARSLTGSKGSARPLRETRPNFAFLEQLMAQRLGGEPEDHSQLALAVWAILHGTSMLLLCEAIPEAYSQELRQACRTAIRAMLEKASSFRGGK